MQTAHNLLAEPIVRAEVGGRVERRTLPGVFAGLMRDEIESFPGLRAHQRHPWHAFLTQLGAIALHAAGVSEPPTDEAAWRTLLAALAPDHPSAFCLVAPPEQPALLQPPVPDGIAALKNRVLEPDELDILVLAKNHDLKQGVMREVDAQDWLFALLTLQTSEGFLGAGNYGVSRMNGGFGNRPALGVVPPGGPGAHVRRDIRQLLRIRQRTATLYGYAERGGVCLLWLLAWDGAVSLSPSRLDPFYIEVCRRVRLVTHDGRLEARAGSSKAPRVKATPGGLTGDPWAPLTMGKSGGRTVLTLGGGGFTYRRMVGLMYPAEDSLLAPLQQPSPDDPSEGLVLLARALVRGQGKTEGYHERSVPISRKHRRGTGLTTTDPEAAAAHERVGLAGTIQNKVLKPALLALFENGPKTIDFKSDGALRKAAGFLSQFDRYVDGDFFPDLWREIEADSVEVAAAERRTWVRKLVDCCDGLVDAADRAGAKSSHRRYRAYVRAKRELHGAKRRELGSYFPAPDKARDSEETHDVDASA